MYMLIVCSISMVYASFILCTAHYYNGLHQQTERKEEYICVLQAPTSHPVMHSESNSCALPGCHDIEQDRRPTHKLARD